MVEGMEVPLIDKADVDDVVEREAEMELISIRFRSRGIGEYHGA